MGKLLDFLKRTAGEASLHSGLGLWRQKVSAAIDAMGTAGGGGVFNWAAATTPRTITTGTSANITDAAVTHTSVSGRVRVLLEFAGNNEEVSTEIVASLLVDGVEQPSPKFMALPNTELSRSGFTGWWIVETDGAAHVYTPRISNGGAGIFTIDPSDTVTQFVILSVEDVAAAP